MNNLDEVVQVLNVLNSMKDCIDRDDTYSTITGKGFNLTRQNGICWHVYAHTASTWISPGYLKPVFAELSLHHEFPVEFQITGNAGNALSLFWAQRNLYVMDSEPGKVRYKLLCDLIQYFQKVLAPHEVL